MAADLLGKSGQRMLAALIDGEQDPEVLADMALRRMRSKIPQLVQALTGNFGEHHAFLCRLHLERSRKDSTWRFVVVVRANEGEDFGGSGELAFGWGDGVAVLVEQGQDVVDGVADGAAADFEQFCEGLLVA